VCTATVIIVIVSLCLMFVRDQFFSFIDAPDLAFLLTSGARITLAAIAIVLAVVLALRATYLTRVLLAGWASMSIVNIYVVWELQRNEETVHAGDRAVHALRGLFNRDELDRGIIVTNAHPYAAARVAFQLASRSPVVLTTSDALARTSQSTKWTLVLGDEGPEPLAGVSVRAGESTIYLHDDALIPRELQTSKRLMFSFAAASRLRPIARPAHDPEPWGIWLTGSKSEIELPHALPKRGTLLITANLLEPRVQGPVTLTFCGTSFRLALTAALATHRLAYECEEPSNRIELSSMTPVSPRGLGLSNDARELSVALATIAVHGARADAQQEALARENAK
jgi:hypothetical protein